MQNGTMLNEKIVNLDDVLEIVKDLDTSPLFASIIQLKFNE